MSHIFKVVELVPKPQSFISEVLLFFSKPSLQQPLRVHLSSVASYLAPRSGILQKEGNVLAGLQTSRVRSVLGGELMSIVSSIVVKLTVGPY